MYKKQKPLTVSSGILSLLLTALVWFIAAGANAQTEEPIMTTQSASSSDITTTTDLSNTPLPAVITLPIKLSNWQTAVNNREIEINRKRTELASTSIVRTPLISEQSMTIIAPKISQDVQVLNDSITSLNNIRTTLANHLQDLNNSGVDTNVENQHLDEVGQLLTAASTQLQNIDINIRYFVTSPDPKTDWIDVKQQLTTTVDILTDTKVELTKSIVAIRQLSERLKPTTGSDAQN